MKLSSVIINYKTPWKTCCVVITLKFKLIHSTNSPLVNVRKSQDITTKQLETNYTNQDSLQRRKQILMFLFFILMRHVFWEHPCTPSAVVRVCCYQLEMNSFLHPSLMNKAILCLCMWMWCVYVGWVLRCVCPDASYQFIKPINPLGCEELSIAAGSINAASSRLRPVLKMHLPLLLPH